MEFALPTALVVLALIVVYRRVRGRSRQPAVETTPATLGLMRPTIVLDLDDPGSGRESVRRLVEEAAARFFARTRDQSEVDVLSRSGRHLGRVTAKHPSPHVISAPPLALLEPHVVRRTPVPPGGLEDEIHASVTPRFDAHERPAPRRPFADSFDLPAAVRDRLHDADDPIDLLRAILEAGGLRPEVSGDVVRVGDRAIVIVSTRGAPPSDALTHAYLRFKSSGAATGIVLGLRFMDPGEVGRREAFAPELRHVGTEAIQRMADAVSIGANPLDFAAGAPVVEEGRAGGSLRRTHGSGRAAG